MSFPIAKKATAVKELGALTRLFDYAIDRLNATIGGKLNALNNPDFPFTLTAGAASTVLTDDRLGIDSVVIWDPVTANAATELAAGTMYTLEANRSNGSWTVTHANNAQTDRTFNYCILG